MTPTEYRKYRQGKGSLRNVAKLLGVDPGTIIRREAGRLPINREAELAMLSLPDKEK